MKKNTDKGEALMIAGESYHYYSLDGPITIKKSSFIEMKLCAGAKYLFFTF